MVRTDNSIYKNMYYFFIVLLMLKSMKISWLWSIPNPFFTVLAFLFTCILLISTNAIKFERSQKWIVINYLLVVFLGILFSPKEGLFSLLIDILHYFIILVVILLKEQYKIELFNFVIKTLTIILIITIPAWLLYLVGVPFPHGPVVDIGDDFHFMRDYGLFVRSENSVLFQIIPRFASVFLEPGWIGTICFFSVLGLRFKNNTISVLLCLFAIFLSFSLSAIINLIICVSILFLMEDKSRVSIIVSLISIFGFIYVTLNFYKGNDPIKTLVIERLMYDDESIIAGNNRTTEIFNQNYERFTNSSERWFGIRYRIGKSNMMSRDWLNQSSGIRKEIMYYGYIGTGVFLSFLILLFRKYKSKISFVFLIGFLLASFVRNLWRYDYYLIFYIVTMSFLYYDSKGKLLIDSKRIIRWKNL